MLRFIKMRMVKLLVAAARDITERKKAEEDLKKTRENLES